MVVNGDDLGASRGVNRGIAEAHRRGVLTSASLMVEMAASGDAARLVEELPAMSVGLHVDLTDGAGRALVDLETGERCEAVLRHQVERFRELIGRLPTHLDSHRNVHRHPRLLPHFIEAARFHGLPLRERSPIRYVSAFYGQWNGETHPEQIGVGALLSLLDNEVGEGVIELSCHPGYCDRELRSSYRSAREIELRTLCDPGVRRYLAAQGIRLVNFTEAVELVGTSAVGRAAP